MKQTQEGKIKLYYYPGETSKKTKVFFNPEMKLNRDVSVLALQVFQEEIKRKLTVMDVLAASGVRGLRYSKEAKGIDKVILNDLNPSAVKLMKKNIKLNKLKKVEVCRKDANVLMSEYKYLIDFIDIDPFGSPIQFLDSAARAVSNKGFLGITATDTAPLSGTYQRTCLRRYSAKPLRTDIKHEVGVRILIANIARECAKYEKGFIPVLCLSKRHYFRVFGKIKKTRAASDDNIRNIGYVLYCHKCGFRELSKEKELKCKNCKAKLDYAGPLWIGNIFDSKFCNKIYGKSNERILRIIKEESMINCLFYDLHDLCKKYKISAPKMDEFIGKLKKRKFKVSRTHFSPTAIRTDADVRSIKKLL